MKSKFKSKKISFFNFEILDRIIFILISLSIIFMISFTLILPIFVNFTLQNSLSSLTQSHSIEDSPQHFNLNSTQVSQAQKNIINYYILSEELSSQFFSEFEIVHYKDVKQILLISSSIYILFLIIVIYFLLFQKSLFNTYNIKIIFKISLSILILCIPCIIFFEYFWRNIFHSILFKEDSFQILQPQYISYYIYSEQFFLIIVGGVLLIQILLFSTIFLYFKYIKK
ncbi:MAG: DUF1461 domain-containing protein [Nanoarchaeota archaeon]|nr:DUF1461 domain-containing protein [Nanoarchaeota archaeon]